MHEYINGWMNERMNLNEWKTEKIYLWKHHRTKSNSHQLCVSRTKFPQKENLCIISPRLWVQIHVTVFHTVMSYHSVFILQQEYDIMLKISDFWKKHPIEEVKEEIHLEIHVASDSTFADSWYATTIFPSLVLYVIYFGYTVENSLK